MQLADLEQRMRAYEMALDLRVLPGVWLVARLDGRGFTRLTKELRDFEAPFDATFHDHMVGTAEHLMHASGLGVLYGYTQSDEVSLLCRPEEDAFGRRLRKLLSVLAGEASAWFSLRLGTPAAFDCRAIPLPGPGQVVDYFRWRAEDALRNALGSHCYWALRRAGEDGGRADAALRGLNGSRKHELLHRAGVTLNDLPAWQRRGTGLTWEYHDRADVDRVTRAPVTVRRRRIRRHGDLPVRGAYADFLAALMGPACGHAAGADRVDIPR